MHYTTVTNLRYSNASHSTVDMDVYFVELGETVPFTASPDDPMDYGRELYAKAMAGDFGPIADH